VKKERWSVVPHRDRLFANNLIEEEDYRVPEKNT
jgi:hypothetical protein